MCAGHAHQPILAQHLSDPPSFHEPGPLELLLLVWLVLRRFRTAPRRRRRWSQTASQLLLGCKRWVILIKRTPPVKCSACSGCRSKDLCSPACLRYTENMQSIFAPASDCSSHLEISLKQMNVLSSTHPIVPNQEGKTLELWLFCSTEVEYGLLRAFISANRQTRMCSPARVAGEYIEREACIQPDASQHRRISLFAYDCD